MTFYKNVEQKDANAELTPPAIEDRYAAAPGIPRPTPASSPALIQSTTFRLPAILCRWPPSASRKMRTRSSMR